MESIFAPNSKLFLRLFLKLEVVSRTSLFQRKHAAYINICEEKCTDMPYTKNTAHTGPRSFDQKGKTWSNITRLKHATVQVLVRKIREKSSTIGSNCASETRGLIIKGHSLEARRCTDMTYRAETYRN